MSWFTDFLTDTARQAAPGIHQGINTDIQRKQRLDEMQKQIPIEVERQKAMMPGEIEKVDAISRAAQARDAANQEAAFRRALALQYLKNQTKAQPPDDPIGRVLGGKYTMQNPNYSASEEAGAGMGGVAPTENVGGLEWLRRQRDVPSGHVPEIKTDAKGTSVEWKPPTPGRGDVPREGVGVETMLFNSLVRIENGTATPRDYAIVKTYGAGGQNVPEGTIPTLTDLRRNKFEQESIGKGQGTYGPEVRPQRVATAGAVSAENVRARSAAELEPIPSPITGEVAPRTTVVKQAEAAGQAIPASERKALSELAVLNQLTDSVDRDSKSFTEPFFGPVAGRYGLFRERITGQMGDAEVAVRRNLADIKDTLLRARSGAQINEQEYTRLSRLVPDITDPINVAKAKMKSFKEALTIITNERQRLQGVSGGAIRGVPIQSTPSAPSAPSQETKTINGKTYIKQNGRWYEQ